MPLYEYRCTECGDVFEVIQKLSDAPLTVHKKCGGTVERLVSPSALQFKGSGWYVTDYARGSSSGSPSGKDGKDASKSTPKSEPAPAKASTSEK
ncbi:MAG TPA: FmdB family zinc ribbon protein [Bryobacteraceae bacterium]|jgi:putative FmdB family regulatory protein|nr:FmdB family zinc ribbon protein [Bryobacteraceae bacterium]